MENDAAHEALAGELLEGAQPAEVGLTDSPCGTFSDKLRALPDMICIFALCN